MTTLREAAQQALEQENAKLRELYEAGLKAWNPVYEKVLNENASLRKELAYAMRELVAMKALNDQQLKDFNALRAALAEPVQEPVAWELRKGKTDRVLIEITNNPQRAHDWKASLEEVVPLYYRP